MAVHALDQIEKAITDLDFTEPLEQIREELRKQTEHGFNTETDPEGNKWPALKPQTIKRKLRRAKREDRVSRNKILQDKGDLADSMIVKPRALGTIDELSKSTLEWGTEDKKADFHDKGTTHMPKREFLGISQETEDKIESIVADYVEKKICSTL